MRPMYLARGIRGGFLRACDVRVKGVKIKSRLKMLSFWLCLQPVGAANAGRIPMHGLKLNFAPPNHLTLSPYQ